MCGLYFLKHSCARSDARDKTAALKELFDFF